MCESAGRRVSYAERGINVAVHEVGEIPVSGRPFIRRRAGFCVRKQREKKLFGRNGQKTREVERDCRRAVSLFLYYFV